MDKMYYWVPVDSNQNCNEHKQQEIEQVSEETPHLPLGQTGHASAQHVVDLFEFRVSLGWVQARGHFVQGLLEVALDHDCLRIAEPVHTAESILPALACRPHSSKRQLTVSHLHCEVIAHERTSLGFIQNSFAIHATVVPKILNCQGVFVAVNLLDYVSDLFEFK